jgi:glycosyl transferase family 25
LDIHKERLLNVNKQMDRLNIKSTRFSAIDANSDQVKEIFSKNTTKIKKGEIGCTMSHREIWKDSVKYKIPWTLVFEDDIHIPNNVSQYEFGEGMIEALSGRRNPQIVYFGACYTHKNSQLPKHNQFNSIVVTQSCPNCTHAYAFTWKIAQVLLKETEVYAKPVDTIISNKVCKPGLISLVSLKEELKEGFGTGLVFQNRDTYDSVLRDPKQR